MGTPARGRLITVEGIEGAGKSTHIEAICETLRGHDIEVVATREPGGTPLGEQLRDILLANGDDSDNRPILDANAELLLMFAARSEHIKAIVRPALLAGCWVVSDRFSDASHAYQGGGRGCDKLLLEALEQSICAETRPDLTFLLDIAPDQAAARVAARGTKDRFEAEDSAFFTRVRQAYLALAEKEPARWRVVSAEAEIERVREAITTALEAFLDACRSGGREA